MKSNRVYILISTYNGEKYLKEQLDSIFNQSYKNFRVILRDDCSTDSTLKIALNYDIEILSSNKNLGAKKSFEELLHYALNHHNSNYFMFCDQDDVWDKDKVQKSMDMIIYLENLRLNDNNPILVHSDLRVVDEKLNLIDSSFFQYSNINPNICSFNRLLMQNTVTGCTMIFNRKLADISLPIADNAIMHDWWIALVASQFGMIYTIKEATISYRQHSSNEVGAVKFNYLYIIKKIKTFLFNRELLQQKLYPNINQAKAFFKQYGKGVLRCDRYSINSLKEFISIFKKSFFQKRLVLVEYNILKQGFIRNMALLLKI